MNITSDDINDSFNNIFPNIVKYVDDSINIIDTSDKNVNELQQYINKY